MIILIKCSQKGNKMSDNWLDEYKEGLFSGRIPMRNPKIKKPGDPEYYYYDPRGVDKSTPLKDRKLIGVPTADTPNPALAEMNNSAKDKQLPQQNPNIYYDEKNDVYCDRSTGFEDDSYDVDLYGEDIPESLVKKMHADEGFKKGMVKYIQPIEGCYSNLPKDRGGETKYGITKRWYPKEDIKGMSRQRSNAITYRDYWLNKKLHQLPAELSGPVLDHLYNVGQEQGMKNFHNALGIKSTKEGRIAGPLTMQKLSEVPINQVLDNFISAAINYYDKVVENDPSQKVHYNGWINRANNYRNF